MFVLTLNGGSSSLKMGLFDGEGKRRLASGAVERIGSPDARVSFAREGATAQKMPLPGADHAPALDALLDRLAPLARIADVTAVGHRIVHGGPRFDRSVRVTDEVLAELRRLAPIDPDHLPAEIAIVEAVRLRAPALAQVACFDTAFHRAMPRVSKLLPLPRAYEAKGIERYGFHGLSYTYLLEELLRSAGAEAANGRIVLAHLGAGSSLAAVHHGRPVDTTMGFTPAGGIMMATRSGDLDPGTLVHLLRTEALSVDALDDLVNRRSGLLGVSGTSADMRDLLTREADDERAKDAVGLYCHGVRKAIGAFAAVLGGLDTLVFAGGIGENSAVLRARIAENLAHLGVVLDDERNARTDAIVSREDARCSVRVIRTDEEAVIARETASVIRGGAEARPA